MPGGGASVEHAVETVSEEALGVMVARLIAWGAAKVMLFGSHARGDVHEGSDIDLLVVKASDKRFADRIEEVMLLLRDFPAVEPLVYTPEEFGRMQARGVIDNILAEGRVLYDESQS